MLERSTPPGAVLINDVSGPVENSLGSGSPTTEESPSTAQAASPQAPSVVVTVDTTSNVEDGDTTNVSTLLANPGPDGKISFAEAIHAINHTGPNNTIRFSPSLGHGATIPPGVFSPTLLLLAPYTTIDGDTNGDNKPDIAIGSVNYNSPFVILSDHNRIRNLSIQGMVIHGAGAHDNQVTGCYLGTDVDGMASRNTESNGVEIRVQAHDNIIENNVIAGNSGNDPSFISVGIMIFAGANHNIVRGNRIGVNIAGRSLPNEIGVVIGNAPFTIGGDNYGDISANQVGVKSGSDRLSDDCQGACNLISGNLYGIAVYGAKAVSNTIAGNYIGAGPTGLTLQPNVYTGIWLEGGSHNTIGGDRGWSYTCSGLCNVISGNGQDGIYIGTSTLNQVLGNFIGLSATGFITMPNGYSGVTLMDLSSYNQIGSEHLLPGCTGGCNAISGNHQNGVLIAGDGVKLNSVLGNYVGVSPHEQPLGNVQAGVVIMDKASQNTVGGNRPDARKGCVGPCNLISANRLAGVHIQGTGTTANRVKGNFIGVDTTGMSRLENLGAGVVMIGGTQDNILGGSRSSNACTGPCNLIGALNYSDVELIGAGTNTNLLQGNYIGVGLDGRVAVGSRLSGVRITDGASQNVIGGILTPGPCVDTCNTISYNGFGVTILGSQSRRNTIRANSIYRNAYIGIDLGGDGVTLNDPNDADTGPNYLRNYPSNVVSIYDPAARVTRITGVLELSNPTTNTIEIYGSQDIIGSNYGEGQFYLGSATPNQKGEFSLILPGTLKYPLLTATATDEAGNTSEFSLGDTDGDRLYDAWEKKGFYSNGVFVDLPSMGADPLLKDIFVQADWMDHANLKISNADLYDLMAAFGSLPVHNPLGLDGISLHVDQGADSVMWFVSDRTWGGLSRAISHPYAPTIGSFDGIDYDWRPIDAYKQAFLASGRAPAFHYMCFCNNFSGDWKYGGISRRIPGSDFLVTLGDWPTPGGTSLEKIGTFMHELGHNLGLHHGGGNDENYKPNYLSVMNYTFSTIGIPIPGSDQVSFEYSARQLPDLNEKTLNEAVGIQDPDHRDTYWSPEVGACATNPNYYKALAYPQLDWDCNGTLTASSVTRDVNDSACVGPGSDLTLTTPPANDDVVINNYIFDGPNRTCDTPTGANDEQVRPVGNVQPDVLAGFNDLPALRFDGGGTIGDIRSVTLPVSMMSIGTESEAPQPGSDFTQVNSSLSASAQPTMTTTTDKNTYELLRSLVPAPVFDAEQHAPVAIGTATVYYGTSPMLVRFDGRASHDPDGSIVSYQWNFGDGAAGSGAVITHTYQVPDVYSAFLTVTDNDGNHNLIPERILVSALPALEQVSLNQTDLVGGFPTYGQILFRRSALPGGESVSLSSSDPAAASLPASVTVNEGNDRNYFDVITHGVATNTLITVSASYQGISQTAELTLYPAELEGVNLSRGDCRLTSDPAGAMRIMGGFPITVEVTLDGEAPPTGAQIALSSSNSMAVSLPAGIAIPYGDTRVVMEVLPAQVVTDTLVTIYANYRASQAALQLVVTPPLNYSYTELGNFRATAMNDLGQVVGTREITPGASIYTNFLWQSGLTTDLGRLAPPGYDSSWLSGINDAGEMVGTAYKGTHSQAIRLKNGILTQAPSLAPYTDSIASKINSVGQVIGALKDQNGNGEGFLWDPLVGSTNVIHGLATLPNDLGNNAYDINNLGVIVGSSYHLAPGSQWFTRAVFLKVSASTVLTGTDSRFSSDALGINDRGTVIVYNPGIINGAGSPYLWKNGVMTPVPASFEAIDINNQDHLIGDTWHGHDFPSESVPYYFDGSEGYIASCLLPPHTSWQIKNLVGLNDQGDLLAWGYHNGNLGSLIIHTATRGPALVHSVLLPLIAR